MVQAYTKGVQELITQHVELFRAYVSSNEWVGLISRDYKEIGRKIDEIIASRLEDLRTAIDEFDTSKVTSIKDPQSLERLRYYTVKELVFAREDLRALGRTLAAQLRQERGPVVFHRALVS